MTILKNFCVEPETEECICRTLRCGGLDTVSQHCPEHGATAALGPIQKTHFHAIAGEELSRDLDLLLI